LSAYLLHRLIRDAALSPKLVAEAFLASERLACSLLEVLLTRQVELAEVIADCFAQDGALADPGWRLDAALMRELPPGLPERWLAFPFRERAGSIEVVTVTPLDPGLKAEMAFHLKTPLRFYRGYLQGLLAAAGARVDWNAVPILSRPPAGASAPIPLVRRQRSRPRERIQTSPGLGARSAAASLLGEDLDAPPPREAHSDGSRADRILGASRPVELAEALGPGLPEPANVFALQPHALRGLWGATPHAPIEWAPEVRGDLFSLFRSGSFRGQWPGSLLPESLAGLYPEDSVVRLELLGEPGRGLLVVFPDTGSSLPLRFVALARARWSEI
jgi:hypothetical protein